MSNGNPYIDYTYNMLKRFGVVQDYAGFDKAQSSFDQRKYMTKLPKGEIVCPRNISQRFKQIYGITEQTGKEVPFFIFAHDGRNQGNENSIVIDEIVFSEEDLTLQQEEANYGENIMELLNAKINQHKGDSNFVIIQGHSHPSFRGDIGNVYSVQDLANVVYLSKQSNVQFGACVITPNGKVNMCFYDAISNQFFKVEIFRNTPDKEDAIVVLPAKKGTKR